MIEKTLLLIIHLTDNTLRDEIILKSIVKNKEDKNIIININLITDIKSFTYINEADLILLDKDTPMISYHLKQLRCQFKNKKIESY